MAQSASQVPESTKYIRPLMLPVFFAHAASFLFIMPVSYSLCQFLIHAANFLFMLPVSCSCCQFNIHATSFLFKQPISYSCCQFLFFLPIFIHASFVLPVFLFILPIFFIHIASFLFMLPAFYSCCQFLIHTHRKFVTLARTFSTYRSLRQHGEIRAS